MGERWVFVELLFDDMLFCQTCREDIRHEKVHLYLNVNDEIEEVMCDRCWKRDLKEKMK